MFKLTGAIKALPQAAVDYQLWVAADDADQLPGHVRGTWTDWVPLIGPCCVSIAANPMRAMTAGGDVYIKSLTVYCPASMADPEDPNAQEQVIAQMFPLRQTARVRVRGVVYQVMEARVWLPESDHAEIRCANDLGQATRATIPP